jgi:hypothetical protein
MWNAETSSAEDNKLCKRVQKPPMKKLWAKKLRRGCAIPIEKQAFEGQRPRAAKSLSSGLIFCYFFIKKTAKPS